MHAAESPAGILRAEPCNELAQVVGEGWTSWGRRLSPLPLDETLVPGQQGADRDDPVAAHLAGEQPSEGSKQRPVGPAGAGCGDLTTQHRDLMTQDQYLDVLGGRGSRQ
jgi:hypothetical protein